MERAKKIGCQFPQRERERERQTERQTDRQRQRDRDRETDTERDREKQRDRHTERQRQTHRQRQRDTEREREREFLGGFRIYNRMKVWFQCDQDRYDKVAINPKHASGTPTITTVSNA